MTTVRVMRDGHCLATAELLAREPETGKPRRALLRMPHGQRWWTRQPAGWTVEGSKGYCVIPELDALQ